MQYGMEGDHSIPMPDKKIMATSSLKGCSEQLGALQKKQPSRGDYCELGTRATR